VKRDFKFDVQCACDHTKMSHDLTKHIKEILETDHKVELVEVRITPYLVGYYSFHISGY